MDGYIGEIRMFAANFAPRNWAYCSGQLLSIDQNQALFSILGTTYGGDGQTTFALPNMNSRVPVGTGQNYQLGQVSGTETSTITANNLPLHTHVLGGTIAMPTAAAPANAVSPVNNYFADDGSAKYNTSGSGTMKPAKVSLALGPGGGTGISNLMPYTGISYVICLIGIFPSRN